MASHRNIRGDRHAGKRRARTRGQLIGLGAAAGAVLAFGMMPLASAPSARADVVDDVIDQILSPFMDAATSTVDWDAFLAPTAWDAFFDPTHWDAVFADLGSLDAAAGSSAADPAALVAEPAASGPSDLTALFDQFVYTPLHTAAEDWINSSVGEQVDGFINTAFGSYVIGDGTPGTLDDPTGGAGGWFFGDGGAGWDSNEADVVGGDGGDAGIFGDGGPGGDGGAGAAGGDGGAGGSVMGIGGAGGDSNDGGVGAAGGMGGDGKGWVFGIGGHGGNGGGGTAGGNGGDGGSGAWLLGGGGDGGDAGGGSNSTGLPALGGAGGNGGFFGTHGMVGHYGTLAGVPPSAGSVGITGDWLTNSDGQVVLLHGLNEVYKVASLEPAADGFSDDDAAFLAANGFNVVRLGVIWSAVEPSAGNFDDSYLASIEGTVQTLASHGIYTILDMHQDAYSSEFGGEGAPAWAVQDGGLANPQLSFPLNEFFNPAEQHAWDAFWSNADATNGVGLEDAYSQMLEHVANYFNGNSDVAGIEIMNEPSPGSSTFGSTLVGSPFFDSQQLTPFYDQAASAIRAVDPTTPVFYEPDILSNAGLPINLGTVDSPDTVFSFHDYCEFDLGSLGCFPSVSGIVGNAVAYADAQGIPAFMTEFGATNDQTAIAAPMQGADQSLIGWTEWAYTSQGDITTSASPPSSESLVYDPTQPVPGTDDSNVNTANLATLAEPYPQLVSGTPNTWSFDNGTFQFSYSTERVDGLGSFPGDSQTTISVPAVEFPNGYQVTVTGGEVVSGPPNGSELVIASDTGAATVSVVVSPP